MQPQPQQKDREADAGTGRKYRLGRPEEMWKPIQVGWARQVEVNVQLRTENTGLRHRAKSDQGTINNVDLYSRCFKVVCAMK